MDKIFINNTEFPTLVAVSESEQNQGLMWVKWPPPVMIFPYRSAGIRKFWMKNTISPLDIVFCNGNSIVDIRKGEPLSTAMIGPDQPVDLVIELPAGTVEQHGIKVGQPVQLVYSPKTAARFITT